MLTPPCAGGQRRVWLNNVPSPSIQTRNSHTTHTPDHFFEGEQASGVSAERSKKYVKNKTHIRFFPQTFLSSTPPPSSLKGKKGHRKGSQDLVLWDQRPDPYLLYLNTVIGLGQREQLTLCDSQIGDTKFLFPEQSLLNLGVVLGVS